MKTKLTEYEDINSVMIKWHDRHALAMEAYDDYKKLKNPNHFNLDSANEGMRANRIKCKRLYESLQTGRKQIITEINKIGKLGKAYTKLTDKRRAFDNTMNIISKANRKLWELNKELRDALARNEL